MKDSPGIKKSNLIGTQYIFFFLLNILKMLNNHIEVAKPLLSCQAILTSFYIVAITALSVLAHNVLSIYKNNKEAAETVRITRSVKFVKSDKILS